MKYTGIIRKADQLCGLFVPSRNNGKGTSSKKLNCKILVELLMGSKAIAKQIERKTKQELNKRIIIIDFNESCDTNRLKNL
jgi:hypothetical protein